jgi:hypothetical protein
MSAWSREISFRTQRTRSSSRRIRVIARGPAVPIWVVRVGDELYVALPRSPLAAGTGGAFQLQWPNRSRGNESRPIQ